MKGECECRDWARDGLGRNGEVLGYVPNHHPKCKHYNRSLIVAYIIKYDNISYYDSNFDSILQEYTDLIKDGEEVSLRQVKIHKEAFDQMAEFAGW